MAYNFSGAEHSTGLHRNAHSIALVMVLVTSMLIAGCIPANPAVAPGGDSMTITEEQIAQLHASSAYDIVALTHAEFFHSRGRESMSPNVPPIPVHIFLDDTYYGEVNTLRGIGSEVVMEIRFFQSYDAQYKFGSGHMGGVIQVITKN